MGNKIREGIGYERLFLFLLAFCLLCHIVACFWILTTTFRDSESWASSMGYEEQDHVGIYITSYYFIVTTITTVGYGDIVPVTQIEKIFCIVNMIVGVCAFSFASGSLASIMQNKDSQEAIMQGKVNRLNQIYKDYKLKLDLYSRLKLSLAINNNNHVDDLKNFMDELPHNLKIETALFVHKETYRSINFLKERSSLFICWICPLFKPSLVLQN